jgi:hypothetical protein
MNKHFSSVLGLSVALLVMSPLSALAATPTLHYPLDEGKGTASAPLVGTGQALISGGAGWVSGKAGTAVGFDGKSGEVVSLGENILPQATEGSLSLWLKANSLSDNNFYFSARNTSDERTFWTVATDHDGRLVIRYRLGSSAVEQKVETSAILEKNTWYNVIIVANSLKYMIYVNGEEVLVSGTNIGKWIPDLVSGTLRYTLGALDASDRTGVLDGIVDDVRAYGAVLTVAEVKALYDEVNVKGPSIPAGALPVIQLSVSDKVIPFGGSVSVTWNVTNADACTATWTTSPIAMSGSAVFTKLGVDQAYSIRCTKTGGSEATVGENVTVLAPGVMATSTPSVPSVGGVPVTEIVLGAGPSIQRTLMVGSRGDDVKLLQQYLIKKGLLSAQATGYYGKLTEGAVKAFQKQHGFDQVGFVGPKTRAKLLVTP